MHTDASDNTTTFTVEHTRENERHLHVPGSAKIVLTRKDPYGFWFISFERGAIPESLKQSFTTIDRAYEAVQNYLNDNDNRRRLAERERVRTAKANFETKTASE